MPQVVIENPVINSPYMEPRRHFRFADDGITDEIVEGRRISQYFIPIAAPKKRGSRQLTFETEWTADRIEENVFINRVRERVALWRRGGYVGRDPHHGPPAGVLAGCGPGAPAVLLPGRGAGNRHLPHRSRRQVWRRLDRERAAPGQPGCQPAALSHRLQDGDRFRQDAGHGHAHRLADPEQAREPPGRPLLRCLPHRHARHHHPRPAARALAQRCR